MSAPKRINTTSIVLASNGGKVTLTVDVNLLTLSEEDRRFLFDIIDAVADYDGSPADDFAVVLDEA